MFKNRLFSKKRFKKVFLFSEQSNLLVFLHHHSQKNHSQKFRLFRKRCPSLCGTDWRECKHNFKRPWQTYPWNLYLTNNREDIVDFCKETPIEINSFQNHGIIYFILDQTKILRVPLWIAQKVTSNYAFKLPLPYSLWKVSRGRFQIVKREGTFP